LKKFIIIFLVGIFILGFIQISLAAKGTSEVGPRSAPAEEPKSTDKTERITGDYDTKNAQQFRGLMPDKTCIRLYQSDFDNLNTNLVISYPSGCVELMEDITFNYGIILSDGSDGFYFTCNNHWLRGSPSTDGIIAFNDVIIRDCTVTGRLIGFVIHDNTRVENGQAFSNDYGFLAYNNAVVDNSWARENLQAGFIAFDQVAILNSNSWSNDEGYELQNDAAAVNSNAQSNTNEGFEMWGNSEVFHGFSRGNYEGYSMSDESTASVSTASYNTDEGFELFDRSRVFDSSSSRNSQGFDLNQNTIATGSSTNNNGDGFVMRDFSSCVDCNSNDNQIAGFWIMDNSEVSNSRAMNNLINGFEQYDYSTISESTASHNLRNGFALYDSSQVSDSTAQYNNDNNWDYIYGIRLNGFSNASNVRSDNNDNGIWVDQGAKLLEGYRVCNNDAENIFVNGGYVEGRYQTGPIGGAGNWQNAVLVPCGGGGGSSPLYLKAEQQGMVGQSPEGNSWVVLVIAIIALMLIFFTYRNFSAYRINRNRMNTRRRR